ncbi:hypothetical protein IEQ34_008255 [Dendrobium chrysotoxum]|uniref:Uncharacterized protein n=1 Tax=Dendrobium chrysotoxum TaxID=161865 RepID=A0AAV7H7U8_DENCH|nr:hypothetical protein IEQ34_008255 [Dendrobium chrysotoxum]
MWSDLSQLSYRSMSIIMGLIMFLRDHGDVLSLECYFQMGHLISDTQGHISFRSKKPKDLPIPLHVGAEDLLKILNLPNVNTLHYEVCNLSRYVDEEYLFKVRLSTQAERSHAHMLKNSTKVPNAGEYKKKYDGKIKEMKVVEEKLVECRAELATMETSASLQNQQMDCLHIELVDAQAEAKSKSEQSPSRVIEEFKKPVAFKMIVHNHIQEAYDHIYDVEVKALELECMEEGFIRVQDWSEIEGLTLSQASGDSSSDFDGDEIVLDDSIIVLDDPVKTETLIRATKLRRSD